MASLQGIRLVSDFKDLNRRRDILGCLAGVNGHLYRFHASSTKSQAKLAYLQAVETPLKLTQTAALLEVSNGSIL